MEALVWRVEHFKEIDSTNAWLVNQARGGAEEGLVAHADFQTAGRGRRDRHWEAAAGSALLCSVLLRPELGVEDLQLCVAVVALSTRAAVSAAGRVQIELKWPNDLVIGDVKVAGLLAEVVATERGLAVVVGVGVNLTDRPELKTAVSLREASGVTVTSHELLGEVLAEIVTRRPQLDDALGRRALMEEYAKHLATLGRAVRVERVGDVVFGTATGVNELGQLVVRAAEADVTVTAGDVIHLRSTEGDAS